MISSWFGFFTAVVESTDKIALPCFSLLNLSLMVLLLLLILDCFLFLFKQWYPHLFLRSPNWMQRMDSWKNILWPEVLERFYCLELVIFLNMSLRSSVKYFQSVIPLLEIYDMLKIKSLFCFSFVWKSLYLCDLFVHVLSASCFFILSMSLSSPLIPLIKFCSI